MIERKKIKVRLRGEQSDEKFRTKIWKEIAAAENPYIAERVLCHGYDLLELTRKRSYVDVIFLLFLGELPGDGERELLESLMIGLCNPGPRHNATRAAMVTGAGKTESSHILPISLSILSGAYLGAGEVQSSMRFLRKEMNNRPGDVAIRIAECLSCNHIPHSEVSPGFGSVYSGIDRVTQSLASDITKKKRAGDALRWGAEFADDLIKHGYGWLPPGLAAAAFIDLGLNSLSAAGMFQLISAPGLLAHGLEMCSKPESPAPFLDDDHYLIEDKKDGKN
jgi:citrate synthase